MSTEYDERMNGRLPLQSYWSLSCTHGLYHGDELILCMITRIKTTTTTLELIYKVSIGTRCFPGGERFSKRPH